MVIKDFFMERSDGVKLFYTYSDTKHKLIQVETGLVYDEAIDVENAPYTYIESDEMIEFFE